MATYEHNALMQYIDKMGNMHINYPATKAENVMIGDSDVQIEINALQKRPVNNNLLDNPWFTINQRGQSSYTSGYSVDRWKIASGSVTVNSKGVTLTDADFFQIIPAEYYLEGRTVTASVLLNNGTIYSGTYTFSTTVPESYSFDTVVPYTTTGNTIRVLVGYLSTGNFQFSIQTTGSVDILAAKLEIGTESTLANDTAPNYQLELLKCQYYYRIISAYSLKYYLWEPNIIYFNCNLPMRTKPSVTINPNINIYVNSNLVTGFSFSYLAYHELQSGSMLFLKAEKTNHGINSNSQIMLGYDYERAIVALADL